MVWVRGITSLNWTRRPPGGLPWNLSLGSCGGSPWECWMESCWGIEYAIRVLYWKVWLIARVIWGSSEGHLRVIWESSERVICIITHPPITRDTHTDFCMVTLSRRLNWGQAVQSGVVGQTSDWESSEDHQRIIWWIKVIMATTELTTQLSSCITDPICGRL